MRVYWVSRRRRKPSTTCTSRPIPAARAPSSISKRVVWRPGEVGVSDGRTPRRQYAPGAWSRYQAKSSAPLDCSTDRTEPGPRALLAALRKRLVVSTSFWRGGAYRVSASSNEAPDSSKISCSPVSMHVSPASRSMARGSQRAAELCGVRDRGSEPNRLGPCRIPAGPARRDWGGSPPCRATGSRLLLEHAPGPSSTAVRGGRHQAAVGLDAHQRGCPRHGAGPEPDCAQR